MDESIPVSRQHRAAPKKYCGPYLPRNQLQQPVWKAAALHQVRILSLRYSRTVIYVGWDVQSIGHDM